MNVQQIYDLTNTVTKEVLGSEAVVNEDLSNVVDIGNEIFNADAVDNYVKSLVNHIGKVLFVNRPYSGSAPSVLMDGWQFGSVLEKITVDTLPEAEENEEWELTDGASYDPNIFYQPKVSAKFYNKRTSFMIPMSFTRNQVKESFSSADQLNGFISMIYTSIERSLTVKEDALIMRTIDSMIAETMYDAYKGASMTTAGNTRAVNLLAGYNAAFGTTLTKDKALTTPEFIRYAVQQMDLTRRHIGKVSTLFNVGGKDRFTPDDLLHFVVLADFASVLPAYLQSDTFHDEFVSLPRHEVVPCWQGSGTDYGFASTSSINVKTASNNTVTADGILAVMFDRDSLGVANLEKDVRSNYNPKANFYNNFFVQSCGYFNDLNENFVVFFIG